MYGRNTEAKNIFVLLSAVIFVMAVFQRLLLFFPLVFGVNSFFVPCNDSFMAEKDL